MKIKNSMTKTLSFIALFNVMPSYTTLPLTIKSLASRLTQSIRIGGRFLQQTKDTRTKLSTATLGIAGTSFLASYVVDDLNQANKYRTCCNFDERAYESAETWRNHGLKKAACYEHVDKICRGAWAIAIIAPFGAYVVRFPMTATLLAITSGMSKKIRRPMQKNYEQSVDEYNASRIQKLHDYIDNKKTTA